MKEIIIPPEGSIFGGYTVKKSFSSSTGRWHVFLSHPDIRGSGKSMMYARYLVCLRENRILDRHEVVDHVDSNKLNDSIDNLEIVTSRENVQRYFRGKKGREERIMEWACEPLFNNIAKYIKYRWFRKRIYQLLLEIK